MSYRPPAWLRSQLSSWLVLASLLLAILVVYTPVGQAAPLGMPATPTAEATATSSVMPSATITPAEPPATSTPSPSPTQMPTATATASPTQTPVPAPDPASEILVRLENPWCRAGCLTLRGWDELVDDERLLAVLAMTYHYNEEFRPVVRAAIEKGTTVSFGTLPFGTSGRFTSGINRITISTELLDEPLSIIAEVVAHELSHASRVDGPASSPEACVEEEVLAFTDGVETWMLVRLGSEVSPWRAWLDELATVREAGRLEEYLRNYVANSASYQEQCYGIPAPAS